MRVIRDKDGQVRWGALMWALIIAMYAGSALADTYNATGIAGVSQSATNGALSTPIYNVRPISGEISNAQEGDMWSTSSTGQNAFRCRPPGWTATQGWANVLSTNATPSNLVSNPTANTSFTTTFTVPANALTAGKKLRYHASGFYSTSVAANANLSFTLELGPSGQQLATTGNVSTTSGASSSAWEVEGDIQVYTAGASGTLVSNIRGVVNNGSGAITDARKVGRSSGAIDTTVANVLALEVKVSTSDAGSSAKLEQFTLEQLN